MQIFTSVGQYISSQPIKYQTNLLKIQQLIHEAAPDAIEGISYGMPGYKCGGKPLVYFACAKNHIGFYPTPGPIKHFSPELKDFKTSKGAIQFPHIEKLPWELMKKLIQFRLGEINS